MVLYMPGVDVFGFAVVGECARYTKGPRAVPVQRLGDCATCELFFKAQKIESFEFENNIEEIYP
jgi:hypothetical protein